MVQELAGKKVKLEFNDEAAAYGTLAGASSGFFKITGDDGSATFYNIAHVLSIEENDGSEADDADEEFDDDEQSAPSAQPRDLGF